MIPTSISASALEVAQDCLAKWEAHYGKKGAEIQNDAAKLGTTLHEALQAWVTQERMDASDWDEGMLIVLFKMAFFRNFAVIDMDDNQWYKQGIEILHHWFTRGNQMGDIQMGRIISKEVKNEFQVPYMLDGVKAFVPFRYIIDRLDDLGDNVYRVVDYKSQRVPVTGDEMLRKIQPRAYALAVQLAYPNAELIWVQYDFLRYSPVSVAFTKEDNRNTWKYILGMLGKIVATEAGKAPQTLGAGCQYCIARVTCPSALSNAGAGGIMGLEITELVDLYGKLQAQISAQKGIQSDIEGIVLEHLRVEELGEEVLGDWHVSVSTGSTSFVDMEAIRKIVGPEIASSYGKINVGDIPRIKADSRLDDTQKSLLAGTIKKKNTSPSLKIKPFRDV